MIRDQAAIECARAIITPALPGVTDELIKLAAGMIKRSVEIDELQQRVEEIEAQK